MATINLTREEKIKIFKMQCRLLERNAEMLVSDNYDIESVIRISNYGNNKSYTDIEQSKKLTEILPLESADMEYLSIKENGLLVGNVPFVKDDSEIENSAYSHIYDRIACWSLAALISVLPTIDDRNAEFCKDIKCDKWHVYYHGTATLPIIDTNRYENLVDACYEMILKLN